MVVVVVVGAVIVFFEMAFSSRLLLQTQEVGFFSR